MLRYFFKNRKTIIITVKGGASGKDIYLFSYSCRGNDEEIERNGCYLAFYIIGGGFFRIGYGRRPGA